MRAIAVRPTLQFAALAAFLLVAESAVLASGAFALRARLFTFAVIFDLCTVLPLAWWLVRRGGARPRSIARVAVLAIALCALLFGSSVRLLAVPIELVLLWVAW